ncbi:hypothetical protein [Palaeococcus ferrophilus]|uniref:hypothetical protein n=1 Tax=Palaeococcus ferrophilus TaxID=83868 RepID=UPI00064E9245|nr:hypothetical protein [Palaeococcus ferrophilus]
MLSIGIKELDEMLGGVKKGSYILLHEEDPRSLGREIVFRFLRQKLEDDNLVGLFNLSYPMPTLLRLLRRRGIEVEKYLDSGNLAIVDTFGSFHGPKLERNGIQYLSGSLSPELLSRKYADVVRIHKEEWARTGMFEGRELWGVAMNVNEYVNIFGEDTALSYFEVSAEVRRRHRAYREYPTGTNVWVYTGRADRVFASIYRRMDYVIRTRSEVTDGRVRRYLCLLKAPDLWQPLVFEYSLTREGIGLREVD